MDVDCIEDRTAKLEKLEQGVAEFLAYIQNNRAHIPNYGERYRHDETISTGFVESTVNQVVSKVCKETADAVDAAWSTPAVTDSNKSSQRGSRGDLPWPVSGLPSRR